MTRPFTIWLPFPPSVNEMYANARGKGRIKTKEYRDWVSAASKYILMAGTPRFPGPVQIRIDLDDSRNGDADNRSKPVIDFLVSTFVIPDDSKKYVKRVSIGWEPKCEGGCIVEIRAA